jgi:hypothetical protein
MLMTTSIVERNLTWPALYIVMYSDTPSILYNTLHDTRGEVVWCNQLVHVWIGRDAWWLFADRDDEVSWCMTRRKRSWVTHKRVNDVPDIWNLHAVSNLEGNLCDAVVTYSLSSDRPVYEKECASSSSGYIAQFPRTQEYGENCWEEESNAPWDSCELKIPP